MIGLFRQFTVVAFGPSDFPTVREAVIRMHAALPDPTHFITADIDTDLPELLKSEVGLAYGAVTDDGVVALQTIRYRADLGLLAGVFDRGLSGRTVSESSWTIVDDRYRRQGVASGLAARLEQDCETRVSTDLYVATVHPGNHPSLSFYLDLGYRGIHVGEHFGLTRMLLVRDKRVPTRDGSKQQKRERSSDDVGGQQRLLGAGWSCVASRLTSGGGSTLVFHSPAVG